MLNVHSTSNSKDDYRGRYSSSSSKYFDDSKYSNSVRHSYKVICVLNLQLLYI